RAGQNVNTLPHGCVDVAGVRDDYVPCLCSPVALVQGRIARQHRRDWLPRHSELARGPDGVPLAVRRYRHEVIPTHDPNATNVLDRVFVHGKHFRTDAVWTLTFRPHKAAVEHARESHLLHVHVLAADLVGDVEPGNTRTHDLVIRARFRLRIARVCSREF